jgi:hypothetical protein
MISWLNGLLIGIGMLIGMTVGTTVGVKWLAHDTPWKTMSVQYKLADHKAVRGVAIKYDKEIYYSSAFINSWLKNKVGVSNQLRGDL